MLLWMLVEHLMLTSLLSDRSRSDSSLCAPSCSSSSANTSSNLIVIFWRRLPVWRYLSHHSRASLLRPRPVRRWRQRDSTICLMLMLQPPTDGMVRLSEVAVSRAKAKARAARTAAKVYPSTLLGGHRNSSSSCCIIRRRHPQRHHRQAWLAQRVPSLC